MRSKGLGLLALLAAVGCRHEQGKTVPQGTNQVAQVPVSSLVHEPRLSELAAGRCVRLNLREFDELRWTAAVLLIRQNDVDVRRILVALDTAGRLRRYSDIRFGPSGWTIDARSDSIADWGAVSLQGTGRRARGTAADVLDAPGLGRPRSVAEQVMRTCSAELTRSD